jgi:hypothetical protein
VSASSSITIRVVTPPPPGAPHVSITSPADGSFFCAGKNTGSGYFAAVQLTATASDPNNESLTYSWSDSIGGGAAQQVSTASSSDQSWARLRASDGPSLRRRLKTPEIAQANTSLAEVRAVVESGGANVEVSELARPSGQLGH